MLTLGTALVVWRKMEFPLAYDTRSVFLPFDYFVFEPSRTIGADLDGGGKIVFWIVGLPYDLSAREARRRRDYRLTEDSS